MVFLQNDDVVVFPYDEVLSFHALEVEFLSFEVPFFHWILSWKLFLQLDVGEVGVVVNSNGVGRMAFDVEHSYHYG
jgi:hypothetical protein